MPQDQGGPAQSSGQINSMQRAASSQDAGAHDPHEKNILERMTVIGGLLSRLGRPLADVAGGSIEQLFESAKGTYSIAAVAIMNFLNPPQGLAPLEIFSKLFGRKFDFKDFFFPSYDGGGSDNESYDDSGGSALHQDPKIGNIDMSNIDMTGMEYHGHANHVNNHSPAGSSPASRSEEHDNHLHER